MIGVPIRCSAVSALLLRKKGRLTEVLLLERADSLVGAWCQVAGKIEGGETAWRAALREIGEETGLRPTANAFEHKTCRGYGKQRIIS